MSTARGSGGGPTRQDDQQDARRNAVSTQPEPVLSGRTVKTIADTEG